MMPLRKVFCGLPGSHVLDDLPLLARKPFHSHGEVYSERRLLGRGSMGVIPEGIDRPIATGVDFREPPDGEILFPRHDILYSLGAAELPARGDLPARERRQWADQQICILIPLPEPRSILG